MTLSLPNETVLEILYIWRCVKKWEDVENVEGKEFTSRETEYVVCLIEVMRVKKEKGVKSI
ncbi:hypothetical protein Glove_505g26 [Diversispora epigaea]|uniref:Uncharacterized protein n=1 Tax=Diversispora epigaea TaxID=1348612 RepID=A0A397GK58_9GLOM|nr:hypothetical protein Glove_505g26 [Diversispora epigaea]